MQNNKLKFISFFSKYNNVWVVIIPVSVGLVVVFFARGLLTDIWIANAVEKISESKISQATEIFKEAEVTLDRANKINADFCSDKDLEALRDVFIDAQYVKDIGRKKNGTLYCSTSLGLLDEPFTPAVNALNIGSNLTVYFTVPLMGGGKKPSVILEKNKTNVVLNTSILTKGNSADFAYFLSIVDKKNNSSIPLSIWNEKLFNSEDRKLKSQECTRSYKFCIQVMLSQRAQRRIADELLIWDVLFGFILGVLGAFILWRKLKTSASISMRLQRAIASNHLNVVYQPIINFENNKIVSAEALIRWPNEVVQPEEFIAIAEQDDFIQDITAFVINRVCEDLSGLLVDNEGFRVTINVSSDELIDGSLFKNLDKLWLSKLKKSQLGLELTERSTATLELISTSIEYLSKQGYQVYIDDFGTGYSSLAQVSNLSIDYVKIDKMFLQSFRKNAQNKSLIPEILAIARRLNVGLVIEGVEFEEDLSYFRNASQKIMMQGWFFGRPMSASQLITLVNSNAD